MSDHQNEPRDADVMFRTQQQVGELETKVEELEAEVLELRQFLKDILEYLDDHEDVDDGSDGTQRPNWAMSMLLEFGDKLRRESDV